MVGPYVYDSDLAPADHFREVLHRARNHRPPSMHPAPTGEYAFGHWTTYPHSPWPRSSGVASEVEASTVLDTPETNPQPALSASDWGPSEESDRAAVTFRHSGWLRQRRLVRSALVTTGIKPRPLARFDNCGSDPWVVVDSEDSSRLAIHSNHCHSRWCVPCSRERAARIVGNLKVKLNSGPIRFLTLTMKHSDTPLSDQISRLYDSFRRLRRARFWLDAVDGGSAVLELKHSHRDGLWHVHLHCLLEGRYVRHAAIMAEWWRITGDSKIVDIRPCHHGDHASGYITKYITKPIPASVINKPDRLLELITALAGRRLVLTWGTWRGVRLSEPLDSTSWKSIASLPVLYRRRDAGDLDAYLILSRLEQELPEARIVAGRDPPPPHDDPIGLLF